MSLFRTHAQAEQSFSQKCRRPYFYVLENGKAVWVYTAKNDKVLRKHIAYGVTYMTQKQFDDAVDFINNP